MHGKFGHCGVFSSSLCYALTVTMDRTIRTNRRAPLFFYTLDDWASEFVQISAMCHCRLGGPTGGTDKTCNSCLIADFRRSLFCIHFTSHRHGCNTRRTSDCYRDIATKKTFHSISLECWCNICLVVCIVLVIVLLQKAYPLHHVVLIILECIHYVATFCLTKRSN